MQINIFVGTDYGYFCPQNNGDNGLKKILVSQVLFSFIIMQ